MSRLFKLVFVITLLVAGVAEGGSPLWTKTEVTVAAKDAANAGAQNYFTTHDLDQAHQAAVDAAASTDAHVDAFDFSNGQVHVTVSRQARSYVLYRISVLKQWYDVRASAFATPQ
jgi:Flp pilus assembly protein TadG